MIAEVIDPPRGGRALYVVWDGSLDFSLMSPAEVEVDLETPRTEGRPGSPEPDWRILHVDSDPDVSGDQG